MVSHHLVPTDQQWITASITGALFGWLTTYCYGWALSVSGRWLGGNADSENYRTVVAWATVPFVMSLALLAAQHNFAQIKVIDPHTLARAQDGLEIIILIFNALSIIWSVVILLKGIRLLQGFGLVKAIMNAVLPGCVVLGFILAFIGFDRLFSSLLE